MNVTPLNPRWPEELAPRLADLPRFEPPARLRERVLTACPALAPRLLRFATAAGLGALLLLPDDDGARLGADALARLEREVIALRAGGAPASNVVRASEAELARIDAALQAAYDRAADDGELASLWRERRTALETLRQVYRDADRLVRL